MSATGHSYSLMTYLTKPGAPKMNNRLNFLLHFDREGLATFVCAFWYVTVEEGSISDNVDSNAIVEKHYDYAYYINS